MLSANYNNSPELAMPRGAITPVEIEMLRQLTVTVNRQRLSWRGEVALGERDKLEFEIDTGDLPLDIYALQLELERDEVTQGIPVQWNIRRPNNKVSTREWQMQMQEEQYAGDCSVTLLYRGLPVPGFTANILFQVTRLQNQHYEYMREVLKEQNEKVLYSERGRTHELAILTGRKSAAQARYDVLLAHYDRLMAVLPEILDLPHRELKQVIRVQPANNQRALTHQSLKLAARNGASWSPVVSKDEPSPQEELADKNDKPRPEYPTIPMGDFQRKLMLAREKMARNKAMSAPPKPKPVTALPTRVPVPKLEEFYDNYENRFLKMTVQKLLGLTKTVEHQLEEEITTIRREIERSSRTRAATLAGRVTLNEKCIENLALIRNRLTKILHNSFLATVSKLGARRTSVVLRENRYYRQVRIIETDLDTDLNLSSSTVGLERNEKSVRLSSVNQLYEYWVTVMVLQTMVERLGFTVTAKDGRPVNQSSFLSKNSRFNYILQSGGAMELLSPLGKRVVVHYDREYPNRDDLNTSGNPVYYGYYVPYGFGSTKRRPDLAVEVFREDERVPKIIVMDATYSRDPRTLYAKYQYRDSIRDFTRLDVMSNTPARPVVAAWVIYPDEPHRLEHDEFRFGQLPLQPSPAAATHLVNVLRQLLKLAGALE